MFQIRSEDAKYCPPSGGGDSRVKPQEIRNRRAPWKKKKEEKQKEKRGES